MPKGGFSFEGGQDAAGLRFGVIVARFNAHVTGPLFDGCREELTARGYSAEDCHKILGGNLLRVFREVERLSRHLA